MAHASARSLAVDSQIARQPGHGTGSGYRIFPRAPDPSQPVTELFAFPLLGDAHSARQGHPRPRMHEDWLVARTDQRPKRIDSTCPSTVPELSASSVYFRRFPSPGPRRRRLSLCVWRTVCDVGSGGASCSNPVGDATCPCASEASWGGWPWHRCACEPRLRVARPVDTLGYHAVSLS